MRPSRQALTTFRRKDRDSACCSGSKGKAANGGPITDHADWNNLAETRADFPHADPVGSCTIFNIGGNKFRLTTKINYRSKIV
ncbi:MAG TPA: type II toxin-antitoxin system HigB family toxin [Blastocatellia bacterium]|nr:type II toxin-antitoxin system HigB family toxin [Blastocatellia bacterium]